MRSTRKYRDSKTRVVSTIQVRIDGEDQSHRALRHAFEDLARAEQSHLHCGLSWSTRMTPATTTKWPSKMMTTCQPITSEVPDGRHISVLRNLRSTRWRHFSSDDKWSALVRSRSRYGAAAIARSSGNSCLPFAYDRFLPHSEILPNPPHKADAAIA